jgi:flagellar basal body-associated protein FliL
VSAEVIEVEEATESRSRRTLLIVVVLAIVLTGAAAVAWFLVVAPDADAAEEEIEDGVILTLEPLTTTTGISGLRHARVTMAVVLADGVDPVEIEPRVALLQDALLREVATMDADQLRSTEGSDRLRAELSADAREIWDEQTVRRVVLTELLVQ